MIQSINGDKIIAKEREPTGWLRSLIWSKRDSPIELKHLALLHLHETGGFNTQDLAKAFGVHRGTILRNIRKAKKRLRSDAELRKAIEAKNTAN